MFSPEPVVSGPAMTCQWLTAQDKTYYVLISVAGPLDPAGVFFEHPKSQTLVAKTAV